MATQSNRSSSIDFFKGIAAILIVCLHCTNNDPLDSIIHLVGRMAVPMFFIITGYFLPSMIKSDHLSSHIAKILKIILGSLLFYLFMYCVDAYLHGDFWGQLSQVILWDRLGWQFLFAKFPFNVGAEHLWYLMAILYIMCFMQLFTKKYSIKKLYLLIPILFLIGYLISSFVLEDCMRYYYHNYLFIGMPYVLLGSFIREHAMGQRLTNRQLGGLIALFAVLYIAEIGLYVFTGLPAHREHYLGIIPLVSCILIWSAKNPQFGSRSFLTTIGKEYSICIYVVHFYFVRKMWYLFNGSSVDSKLQMLSSIALSLMVAHLFLLIRNYWKTRHSEITDRGRANE